MIAVLLSLLLVAAPEVGAETRRVPPVDQCSADPSFAAFRDDLRQAIARRDRAFILALVTDDIEVDFGGGAGRDTFAQTWSLDRPDISPLWQELGETLSLGCARSSEGDYWSPSFFLDSGEVGDPFETALAIRPGAALHSAPDAASPIVTTLDWDVLTVTEWNGEQGWQRAALADGRSGYVRSEDLRSVIDYRAGFRRIDGRWRIVLIAGD